MPVLREFVDYTYFVLALPLPDLLVTWALTAAFCVCTTELCQRWVSPWLKHRAGTLGRDDDESNILELSVRISSVLYTGIIYVMSLYDLVYGEHYSTIASRVLGLGYIQPIVAASLMSYMLVDMYYLMLRRKYGMPAGRFYTVLGHHIITFLMQPVSFWAGFWQHYGNVIVVIAEATSLLSNLNVVLPDLGYPKDSDVFRLNTVVFAATFILCRIFGISCVLLSRARACCMCVRACVRVVRVVLSPSPSVGALAAGWRHFLYC
jgi:hypothetical protein